MFRFSYDLCVCVFPCRTNCVAFRYMSVCTLERCVILAISNTPLCPHLLGQGCWFAHCFRFLPSPAAHATDSMRLYQWVGWASTFLFMFLHLYKRFVLPFFLVEDIVSSAAFLLLRDSNKYHIYIGQFLESFTWNPWKSRIDLIMHIPISVFGFVIV